MKKSWTHYLSGNWKLKQQYIATIHPSKMTEIKENLTVTITGQDAE